MGGDSPLMAPLHETEMSECEKLRHGKLKDRRGTNETRSTDPFASTTANTVMTGVTSSTATNAMNSNAGSNVTSSFSTTCSTSTQLLSSNDNKQHMHHHHHCCKDKDEEDDVDDHDESEEMLHKGQEIQDEHNGNHGFVAGIQGMFSSGFNRIRHMVHYDDDDDVVHHGV